jgi:hypothetical protein
MITESKVTKTTLCAAMLFTASILVLSSCTSVACLTGLCLTTREVMTKIPWDPPSLSHQNCPDISGKYKARNYGSEVYNYNDLIGLFPQSNDQLGFIHVTLQNPNQVPPGRFIPRPAPRFPRAGIVDQSEFYNSAYVLVKQDEQNLSASLIGGDGKVYIIQTIDFNSPMIGCADGDTIIRTLTPPSGGEEGYGSAFAWERRYRKLDDGSLQFTSYMREWRYDPLTGLVGMGPTGGKTNTGMPREKRYTITFASVL